MLENMLYVLFIEFVSFLKPLFSLTNLSFFTVPIVCFCFTVTDSIFLLMFTANFPNFFLILSSTALDVQHFLNPLTHFWRDPLPPS